MSFETIEIAKQRLVRAVMLAFFAGVGAPGCGSGAGTGGETNTAAPPPRDTAPPDTPPPPEPAEEAPDPGTSGLTPGAVREDALAQYAQLCTLPISQGASDTRSRSPLTEDQLRWQEEQLEREWARSPEWFSRVRKTKPRKLPLAGTLKQGELLEVRIPKGKGVLIDLAHNGVPAAATILSFKGDKPRNFAMGLTQRPISLDRERWIAVFPQPSQPPADAVVVYLEKGTVKATIKPIAFDAQGVPSFPEELAVGYEPPITRMNCGFDVVTETGRAINSPEQAVALLRERYLATTSLDTDLDTCRITVRGPEVLRKETDIDWEGLARRVTTRIVGDRTIYDLTYSVRHCGINSFRFQVASDGWVSHGGCCGK